jgi:hypothetical protein
MPTWLELVLLALASTFWPTLIVIVVLALRVSQPVRVLLWFLIGGLLTTIGIGIAIVFALQGASFMNGSSPTNDPAIYISMGLLSLLAAFVLLNRTARHDANAVREAPATSGKPPLTQRAVESGAPVAFAAGVVLNIVPGTLPFVALKDIAQLDAGNGAKVVTIIVFYVIMFAFVEIPVVAFLFAPDRTTSAVNTFNSWLKRNGRRVGAYVLAAVGLYLLIRGIVDLFR